MNTINRQSLGGIIIALILGSLIALAGSYNSIPFAGVRLFAVCAVLAFVIQWLAFIPAWLLRTEHFYDLTGGVTYLSLIVLVVVAQPYLDVRGGLIAAMCGAWAIRLSTFLFSRVKADGFDRRFNSIKHIPLRFLMTWTLQGLWVLTTFSAGLAVMTSYQQVPMEIFGWVGLSLWILGFGIEVVADHQKRMFRKQPENRDRFITTGLWAWSRHPNYFGEILLWTGIAVMAVPVLVGWQYVTLISPLFVFCLLKFVSGVSMLESSANKRWGNEPEYQHYRDKTPELIMMPPR
ncbi:MAG: DUF1295 domain-containing protein [Pseudomonadales bacterium]|nr:DUF1295 domain-containing protein [Pseudomonadales bacterium]